MADNVTLPGVGSVVAADEISGVVYQRVKVSVGADGAAADLAYGQAVMASSLPVAIASNQSALTVGGAAADDAAASGNPVPAGAVYQAAADSVDDGDVGRLRMSARRALMAGPDFHSTILRATTVANAGDIEVSTAIYTGYAAPTTAFFNGADGGFGDAARYIRVPMAVAGWRDCEIVFQNQLGVSCTFSVIAMATWETNYLAQYLVYSASINNGGAAAISPYAYGSGGVVWSAVPALANPNAYLLIEIDPASDPSSGWFSVAIARRS